MSENCADNRFEIIERAKQDILNSTNISESTNEMEVLNEFLFRCWQMGWLKHYDTNQLDEDNFAKSQQSVTIEGFVCRDEFGAHIFGKEPERVAECAWSVYPAYGGIDIPTDSFPDLKWEDEPLKCKITIEEI